MSDSMPRGCLIDRFHNQAILCFSHYPELPRVHLFTLKTCFKKETHCHKGEMNPVANRHSCSKPFGYQKRNSDLKQPYLYTDLIIGVDDTMTDLKDIFIIPRIQLTTVFSSWR